METDSVAQSEANNVRGHLVDKVQRASYLTYYNLLSRHLLMAKDRDNDSRKMETVLVMQGGGSLGAYECGVYKALSNHGKRFDIVAGTSIGAINAAIITSSIADDDPSKKLEDFWLTLAQSIGSPIAFSLNDRNRAML